VIPHAKVFEVQFEQEHQKKAPDSSGAKQ
jgi:hypothetical protein